jgi:hypothetical protein
MKHIPDVTVMDIDGVKYAVNEMSENVQEMIDTYTDWRREEAQMKRDYLKLVNAMTLIGQQIVDTIRKEKEEEAKGNAPEENVTE